MDCNGDKSTSHSTNSALLTCKEATCSFYGSSQTEGYCSVCYKAFIAKKNAAPSHENSMTTSTSRLMNSISASSSSHTLSNVLNTTNIQSSNTEDDTKDVVSDITDKNNTDENSKMSSTQNVNTPEKISTPELKNNINEAISLRKPETPTPSTSEKISINTPKTTDSSQSATSTTTSTPKTASKAKKRRCGMCKKKIGLTGFECKCGNLYCAIHRYADVHNCTFDYKTDGREKN